MTRVRQAYGRLPKVSRMIKRIIAVIFGVAVFVSLVVVVLLLFGLRPFILQSSSMEPMYMKGSLVWVDSRVAVDDVEDGDVIAYRAGQSIIFHRVVSIDENGFELRGDANNSSQNITLDKSNFVGVESFSIPWIGSALDVVLHHKVVVFIVGIVIIILACLPRLRRRSHRHTTFHRKKNAGMKCSESN